MIYFKILLKLGIGIPLGGGLVSPCVGDWYPPVWGICQKNPLFRWCFAHIPLCGGYVSPWVGDWYPPVWGIKGYPLMKQNKFM